MPGPSPEPAEHARLHEAMTRPAYYPHSPRSVEVIGTPCSTIYLAGDRAYKVKKPIDLGYLDFTTLASRRAACDAELALNRKLAPEVYRRVLPLWAPSRPVARLDDAHPGAEPLNYAIEMRRLPAEGMLTELLRRGAFTPARMNALVERLAAFHASAPRTPRTAELGSPASVTAELRGNARELTPFIGEIHDHPDQGGGLWPRATARRVADWLEREAAQHAGLIARRAAEGRVVDGHGDLHAGNICFDPAACTPGNPEGVVIYDRLEFRDDFRARDVAGEVACLSMTLDAAGLAGDGGPEGSNSRDLGARFLERYAERAGDPDVLKLAPMWKTHYALVRAKVHALRSTQVQGDERSRERSSAARLLNLAAGYTLRGCVAMMVGLPGSGKSYIARHLAAATGALWLRADEIRKQLEGAAPTTRLTQEAYTPSASQRVYTELADRARRALEHGQPVILDATFRSPGTRSPLLELARSLLAPAVLVHCSADTATTYARLNARSAAGLDPSDADIRVYEQLRGEFAPPTSQEGLIVPAPEHVDPVAVIARIIEAWSTP